MKASPLKRVAGVFFSGILCLLILCLIATVALRNAAGEKNIEKILSDKSVAEKVISSETIKSITDEIYVRLGIKISVVSENEHVSGDGKTVILSEEKAISALSEKIPELVKKAYDGQIGGGDIKTAVAEIFSESFDGERNDDSQTSDKLKTKIAAFIEESTFFTAISENSAESINKNFSVISAGISDSSLIFTIILISAVLLLTAVIISVLFAKTKSRCLWLGIDCAISGILSLALFFLPETIANIIKNSDMLGLRGYESVIDAVIKEISSTFAVAAVILTVAAFIFCIIYIVSRPAESNGEEKEKTHDQTALKITYKK